MDTDKDLVPAGNEKFPYVFTTTGAPMKDTESVNEGSPLETRRGLTQRQLGMIALGGAIGVGLVIGSGTALAKSGPASTFIGFLLMGIDCYAVLSALAEMTAQYPSRKGFAGHATRFVDPALGFATSVLYLCNYFVTNASQVVAGSLLIGYWAPQVNSAAWTPILMGFAVFINLLPVGFFGELEFWLSVCKLLTLSGLNLLCLIITLGGVPGQERIGFRYWKNGGAFLPYKAGGNTGKFLGVVESMNLALFAYVGTELIGMTAGEAQNPRRAFPKAIKMTAARIGFFYIFGVFMIGMCVDARSPLLAQAVAAGTSGGASSSPYVVAIEAAGIKGLPSFINACILLFTFSSSTSDLYVSTRTLYGLAMDGHAPKIFTRCTKRGLPYISFAFSACFMLLSLLVHSTSALDVFGYLSSAVALCGGLAWISILSSHIAFMRGLKAQGISRSTLAYASPWQPYMSIIAMFFTCLICIFKGFDSFMPFDAKNFVTNYIAFPIFGFGYVGYKFLRKTKVVPLSQMAVVPGDDEFQDIDTGVDTDGMVTKAYKLVSGRFKRSEAQG